MKLTQQINEKISDGEKKLGQKFLIMWSKLMSVLSKRVSSARDAGLKKEYQNILNQLEKVEDSVSDMEVYLDESIDYENLSDKELLEAMKPLDKIMKDLEPKLKAQELKSKKVKELKVKVLGKDKANTPFWDMTDEQIKKIYGSDASDFIKKKDQIAKRKPNSQKSVTSKIKSISNKQSIETKLLHGVLAYPQGKKTIDSKGVITIVHDDMKHGYKAIIDPKKKVIQFKGKSDDVPFVVDSAKKLKFKFKSL